MKHLIISLIAIVLGLNSFSQTEPILKIGLVADPQYEDKSVVGQRHFRESLWKLNEAIDTFNFYTVDFIQNFGDIINSGWASYDSIMPIYHKIYPEIENYHLLGNHDFSIDSSHLADLLETLSMSNYYYSYVKKGWRFIVLNATDYSYYANPLQNHSIAQINAYYNNIEGQPNHQLYNGAIGKEQQYWLKKELERAKLLSQKVIIFSHMPVRPLNTSENLWNDYEIIDIMENSSNVIAFINGHRHKGDYAFENGIHYITLFGMVDMMISSYGIIEIYKDSLVLKGYGNQKNYILTK